VELLPLDAFGSRDQDGLMRLLEYARDKSASIGKPVLVSITLPGRFLDPLVVLQMVNDPAVAHFFLQSSVLGCSVAGAEPVMEAMPEGEDRFRKAKEQAGEWFEHAVCVGDAALPFAGPHVFCSFGFEDDCGSSEPFDTAGHIYIPRWHVASHGGRYSAVANLAVDAETDLHASAEGLLRAHRRFSDFDFSPSVLEEQPESERRTRVRVPDGSKESFLRGVGLVLDRIRDGGVGKVVLSRACEVESDQDWRSLEIVERLRTSHPECHVFALQNGTGVNLIGASPERLVSVHEGHYETEALAGSIARGSHARMDAFLAGQLLGDPKEISENQLVYDSIRARLEGLGLRCELNRQPQILSLPSIQHLRVPISGEVPDGMHVLSLVEALHPTPALGGVPRIEALAMIRQIEGFPRGAYGGLTGWFNAKGEGDFVVNIRCAVISGKMVWIRAGAGIVEGSDPDREWNETALKLDSMLSSLVSVQDFQGAASVVSGVEAGAENAPGNVEADGLRT